MEINRDKYLNKLIDKIGNGRIKVITGLRRAGKSYLLRRLFKEHLLAEGVPEACIIEIILDDIDFARYRDPLRLGDFIKGQLKDSRQHYFVFIDEIQFVVKVKNPDVDGDYITFYDVLNGLLKYENVDVYVTGSNSKMLSSDVLTEFRGRGDRIHVQPLSFAEYYGAVGGDFDDAYGMYEVYGGLPGAALLVSEEEKNDYLTGLFEELYIKDVVQRNAIRNEHGLRILLNIIASAIGSFTNPAKISNSFKSNGQYSYDVSTIASHLAKLEESFLISEAKRYNIKGRKYIGANSKYYYTDIGLRNARLGFRQVEPTHIMENVIYNELCCRGLSVDVGIVEKSERNSDGNSVKKQLEVDFVANRGSQRYYIQSAYDMTTQEKQIQERNSLRRIDDSFKKIIVLRQSAKPWRDENGFVIMGLRQLLLDDNALDF